MVGIGWKRFEWDINERLCKIRVLQIVNCLTSKFWCKPEKRNVAKLAAANFIVAKVNIFDISITSSLFYMKITVSVTKSSH